MERKNILFITTAYKTGNIVYPILPKLSGIHNVDVLNLFRMSKDTEWKSSWEFDPRQIFYKMCDNLNIRSFYGPGMISDKEINVFKYLKFYTGVFNDILKRDYYNLVILDNNSHIKRMGLGIIYRHFAEQKIPYIGCPHGNREYNNYKVFKRVGKLFDYSFIFGEKEKRELIKVDKKYNHNVDRVFPAGIPANDALKNYSRNSKYILVIPNFTKRPPKRGITKNQKVFTIDTFNDLRLAELSEKYNCPIIIQEKYRLFYEDDSLRKSLKKYKRIVKFISVREDDNKLIADANCVISAPSTLTFKPIQMGVPTVILKKFGMHGNFGDFPGLINPNYKEMKRSFEKQKKEGRMTDFIRDMLAGGVEYNSTELYIDYINKVLTGEISCL